MNLNARMTYIVERREYMIYDYSESEFRSAVRTLDRNFRWYLKRDKLLAYIQSSIKIRFI